ncbi:SRPBCC family protein [Microbacterium atlanticum]|uniref:SRPBCC family protein n=1 Tax=Microbacterium atlanticum TaxID=2782168 RepID=UPI001886AC4B|nr:SRPBCC family protein [Microbacterium atlanticum]
MRRRIFLDVPLPYPPERVFPYFADPARWPDFAPAVQFRQRIGEGPARVGSRWWAIDRILGPFTVRFADELEVIEPPRRVMWHSTAPWNSRVEYVCVAHGGGTRVLADYEGDVAGWLRLVALLPTFVLARILMRDFRGLERLLAAETGSILALDAGVARG